MFAITVIKPRIQCIPAMQRNYCWTGVDRVANGRRQSWLADALAWGAWDLVVEVDCSDVHGSNEMHSKWAAQPNYHLLCPYCEHRESQQIGAFSLVLQHPVPRTLKCLAPSKSINRSRSTNQGPTAEPVLHNDIPTLIDIKQP